mgnify:CR=1 FL=1
MQAVKSTLHVLVTLGEERYLMQLIGHVLHSVNVNFTSVWLVSKSNSWVEADLGNDLKIKLDKWWQNFIENSNSIEHGWFNGRMTLIWLRCNEWITQQG